MTGTTRRQFVGQAAALLSGAALTGAAGAVVGCTPAQDGSATPESDGGHIGDSIDGFLTETVPEGAGLTALAARHGEIVYCKGIGFADRESNIGAECDTVYDIGSITKQFTAAAILKLEMAGELATSDPLSDFVDGLPEDKQDITLHRLLTNTSGLVEQIGDDYDAQSRDGILAAAARSDLLSAPGTEYHYSNVGYSVLAAVIEMVSGIGYEEYLSRYLFVPAGMAHTGYVLPNWERTQVAVEYDAEEHRKADRTTICGTPTAPTGTFVAMVGFYPPRRTCSAGMSRSTDTASCRRRRKRSCSSHTFWKTTARHTTDTGGSSWSKTSARSFGITAATARPTPSSPG